MRIFDHVHVTQRALDYHVERHNVLASNVANVDTPGFRPLELVRHEGGSTAFQLAMRRTHAAHLGVGDETHPFRLESAEEGVVAPGNDGNAVSLEREMAKLGANELRFDGAVRMVRSQLGLLRYAANDGH